MVADADVYVHFTIATVNQFFFECAELFYFNKNYLCTVCTKLQKKQGCAEARRICFFFFYAAKIQYIRLTDGCGHSIVNQIYALNLKM